MSTGLFRSGGLLALQMSVAFCGFRIVVEVLLVFVVRVMSAAVYTTELAEHYDEIYKGTGD